MPKGARSARSSLCADMTAQQSCSSTTPYSSARHLTARHSTVQQTVQPFQPRTRGRTFMPLLEIIPSKKVTATVSLEEPTANLVNQYAAFTRVAADDVVNKALEYVVTKDKDFQKFIDSPNDAKPLHPLRIKRNGDSAPKGRPGRKPTASVAAPIPASVVHSAVK